MEFDAESKSAAVKCEVRAGRRLWDVLVAEAENRGIALVHLEPGAGSLPQRLPRFLRRAADRPTQIRLHLRLR